MQCLHVQTQKNLNVYATITARCVSIEKPAVRYCNEQHAQNTFDIWLFGALDEGLVKHSHLYPALHNTDR